MTVFSLKRRVKLKLKHICCGVIISQIIFFLLLVPPLRNLILYPIWPRSWRLLSTVQIVKVMTMTSLPNNATSLHRCLNLTLLGSLGVLTVSNMDKFQPISKIQLLKPVDRYFLPALTKAEKRDLLGLYQVLQELLTQADVQYYLIFGSLLGVFRHKGLIPWDDDIDIAVNGTDWQTVRHALSCVQSHKLFINANMHWKFFRADRNFPFIDIFFMTEDEHYTWSMTDYARSIVLPKNLVFPLRREVFEGLNVPVPHKIAEVLNVFLVAEICESPSIRHKTHSPTDKIISVPCSSIRHMYDMIL